MKPELKSFGKIIFEDESQRTSFLDQRQHTTRVKGRTSGIPILGKILF